MGGYGSGRRPALGSSGQVVEDFGVLDINRLVREGVIGDRSADRVWKPDEFFGLVVASSADRTHVEIRTDEPRQNVLYSFGVSWTPCTYGGRRPWFICPGSCDRRVGKLYSDGTGFLCRRCQGLRYQSQRQPTHVRAAERAKRIRQRLGGSPNLTLPIPRRPQGMHWHTYDELVQELLRAEATFHAGVADELRRLSAQLDRDGRFV